ncbi:MAG: hypothetical protein V1921_05835 [Candidatus Altiarchaeota archaeon]
MMASTYTRKISKEEATCGFILVEKSRRKIFPESGRRFDIYHNRNKLEVVIDEIPCECVGPQKPHVHYHLHLPVELKAGDKAVIEKVGDKYRLEFER